MDIKTRDTMSKYMVLMDFSDSALQALKYVVSLAGNSPIHIHVFHVIEANEKDEYQLDIVDIVTPKVEKAIKKMDAIVDIISSAGISVSYDVTFGDALTELEIQLQKVLPEVVVASRKDTNQSVDYLINQYGGAMLLLDSGFVFSSKINVAIGYNSKTVTGYNLNPILNLSKDLGSKIQLIHAVKDQKDSNEMLTLPWKKILGLESKVEFSDLVNSSIHKGISVAVKEKNIQLLVVGRGEVSTSFFSFFINPRKLVNLLIKDIKTPIFILGKKNNKNLIAHG